MILVATALLSFNTFAANIECFFTEPFISVRVEGKDTFLKAGDQVTVTDFELQKSTTTIKASAILDKVIIADLASEQLGFNQLIIDLNISGSDGMSDEVYDFEGILKNGNQKLYGGCNLK
jgi:uncharacterized membrane protein